MSLHAKTPEPHTPDVRPVMPADYPYFTKKLRTRLGLVRSSIIEAVARSRLEQDGALADRVHDMKDEAFADLLVEVDQARISQEVAEIKDIEAAQLRIQQQEYGRCLDCRAAIGWRRLDAYPTATRCLGCQERCERSQA